MYNKAETILNEIGFHNITVEKICFNKHLKTTAGTYSHKTKTIEIGMEHFACCTDDEIMNTILHEIAHNICEETYGENHENGGHTKEWFAIADIITEKTGYVITQYLSDTIQKDKNNIIAIPKYYHKFKCKKCGYEYIAYSKKEDPAKVRKRKCLGCLTGHKLLGREYSDGNFECIRSGFYHYEYQYKLQ